MNTNYLQIAVIILFIFMIVRGYRKGFLRLAVTFIGMIAIIVAASKMSPYVTDYLINNTKAYTVIQENVTEKFKEANQKYDNTIPKNQELTINSYELPDILKNNLLVNNTEQIYKMLLVNVFEEYVSAYLAKSAVKALAFVLLFVVLIIAFKVILSVVDLISKIPIIKGLNKFAGGLLGFIEALLIVWVFFFFVIVFIGNDSGSTILKMVADSKFLSILFNNNIIMSIL